ncbi:hypothetical protein [Cohnella sp. AR92]|uniref:hypothetical protein n=1 Tax=Cohnella sp. AR92 TaxID=648716 RepID=UPI000F8D9D32|nr:hypothetical protein [Cohnella sp. AR92]RUS45140.1 hypothetical protein ELR57_21665 [Cohnella sp. AR92]
MNVTFKPCASEDEYAKVSLFLLNRKFDLHPAFSTLQMVELLYAYITQGTIYYGSMPDGTIIAAAAYYHGTPERDFEDKDVALIDITVMDRAYRGTRYFLKGFEALVGYIERTHPEVRRLKLAALSENKYLCRLYSKFAVISTKREGEKGEETVFSEEISLIRYSLRRFHRL